jgi:hypothetical protein
MPNQLPTSDPPNLDLFGNVISSPASAAGRSHSRRPAGPKIERYGPEVVHVSRFRAQDSGKDMPIEDTFGLFFMTSSPSAGLQRSLESRLRARMDVNGSPEYALTWSTWDMPSGPPICALRARVRPISDSGYSGWPTPMAGSPGTETYNPAGNTDSSRKMAALVGWPTPSARDWKNGHASDETMDRNARPLNEVAVRLAGWATPRANEGERGGRGDNLGLLRGYAMKHNATLGKAPNGSPASTGKHGALNPAFSLWLMGFPPQWMASAPSAALVRCAARETR